MARVRDQTVGQRIAARRAELGLSQREIAVPGVSYAYISRIESGTREPSVRALRKLAPKLLTTAHWLETGEPDPGLRLAELVLAHRGRLPAEMLALAHRLIERG